MDYQIGSALWELEREFKRTIDDGSLSTLRSAPSRAGRLDSQPRDELGYDLRRWSWLPGERNALSGPHGERFDVTGGANHRRRWLVADDGFARGEVREDVPHSGPTLQRRPPGGLPDLGPRGAG